MRCMLDTNICIHLMQHQPPEVAARFARMHVGDAVMSAITLAELRAGIERDPRSAARNAAALNALVELVLPVAFDVEAAACFGAFPVGAGRRRDALDRLIAAHAVSLALPLVTNNEADFRVYPGLTTENWLAG